MWITSHRSPFGPPFSPAFLAFQADTLTIDYPGGDLHIQRFRRFAFDHAKHVVHRQVIADGARLLGQRLFKEHRHFDLQIVAARRVLTTTLMRLLAKHGGEDVVEILLTVALLVGLSLATEAGIVAMLPELIVFGAPLLIFQDFQASARSLNLASASFSLLTSG